MSWTRSRRFSGPRSKRSGRGVLGRSAAIECSAVDAAVAGQLRVPRTDLHVVPSPRVRHAVVDALERVLNQAEEPLNRLSVRRAIDVHAVTVADRPVLVAADSAAVVALRAIALTGHAIARLDVVALRADRLVVKRASLALTGGAFALSKPNHRRPVGRSFYRDGAIASTQGFSAARAPNDTAA